MNNFDSKETYNQRIQAARNTLDQLEAGYEEVNSENKLLWEVLFAAGNEAVWEKLFHALTVQYKEDRLTFIIRKIRELLERDRYSVALLGLNHLLIMPINEEPSENVQLSVGLILDQIIAMDIPDLDERDRVLIDTMSWMKEASHSKLRDSVHEYLQANHAKLNQLTANMNAPELILAYLYTLLAFDYYYPVRDMMEYLLEKEWPFLDSKLQEAQFARFLWLTFYLSMDDVLLEGSEQSKYYMEQADLPELILYKKYYAAKADKQNSIQAGDGFIPLMEQSSLFEEHEKAKLWEEIIRFLQAGTGTSASTLKSPLNINKVSSVWQIKNTTDHCPHCSQSKLMKEQVLVDGFKRHSDQAQKQVMFELYTCGKCERVYTYDSLNKKLNSALEPYRCKIKLDPLDYPPKQAAPKPLTAKASKVVTKQIVPATNAGFRWPTTEANESKGQSDKEGNFKLETDLHRLGYKITGLNRLQRWDILVRKAIPKLTLKEIAYTIARNIRLRKSQAGGKTKFAYAIAEWEHDLKRLKQEYYKSNFTWPQY